MKKLFLLSVMAFSSLAHAGPWDFNTYQYAGDGATIIGRLTTLPGSSASGILVYDAPSNLPKLATFDSSLTYSGQVFSISPATLATKYNTPTGNTAQYLRGDGTLATFPSIPAAQVQSDWNAVSGVTQILNKPAIPSATAFNYGAPTARTLVASTSYQALDNTKAADVTISPQCTNATTVVAASACTLQVRQGTGTLNCSTGTVTHQWISTYALGLLLTNSSGSPVAIKVPSGGSFILCATAGTFTFPVAIDQTAG